MIKVLKYCIYDVPVTIVGDQEGVGDQESLEDDRNSNFSELKDMVISYAAYRSEEFMRYGEFRTMLQECGEIALPFIDAVNRRFV
jgi:hypothetical protein